MKITIAVLISFFIFQTDFAQIKDPVKWTTKTEKISETEFNLIISGLIEKDWHVYSQFTPDGGSLPIVLDFREQKGNFELLGKAVESPYKKSFNEIFEVEEYYFENKMTVTQKIKLTNKKINKIQLNFEYQACKQSCISDQKLFTFTIPNADLQENTLDTKPNSIPKKDTIAKQDTISNAIISQPSKLIIKPIDKNNISKQDSKKDDKKGLWSIFLLAFLGGFAALLTPCVFPMIPMTVSFFTKQSKTKAQGKSNAIVYGISIILIYVVLGSLVTAIFGADALNALSTNVWFNILFFGLLLFFAASFLGAFEIILPNSWANKIDKQADRGGFIGILFMALALAVVSFSCTGPIVGTLLVEAASKGGFAPVIGMLGFSSALALPFMLFAMFPGWLNSLPKSGGWLNTVKVSLGFLELALAFKFLSKADLVTQSHLLQREVFLAIWIAIFGAWALYLFGKITLPHDSPSSNISVGRLFTALLVTTFTIYLIPGLWGAPLKIISGFPPPLYYSESPDGIGAKTVSSTSEKLLPNTKKVSHGLTVFLDYDAGMAHAKQVNKPVLLDFTGHGCENCRKMEDYVWSDKQVLQILKNDLIIISLYVDEKTPLDDKSKYISPTSSKQINTIGNKWSDFQISKYKTNTQPQYLVLDNSGKTISDGSTSYDPDIQKYLQWLSTAISRF